MVFVPRFLRPVSFLPAAALLLLALATTGCEDKHIGRPCQVIPGAAMQPTAGTTAVINSAALECPSRICLLPSVPAPRDTGPTCSAECSDDGDCDDYEQRNKSDVSDKRCGGSFVCRVVTNLGGFACRKLCVCNDFLTPADTGTGRCNKS